MYTPTLRDYSDCFPKRYLSNISDVFTIEADRATSDIVEAVEQPEQGRLARPGLAAQEEH